MKCLLLLSFSTIMITSAFSQTENMYKRKPREDAKKKMESLHVPNYNPAPKIVIAPQSYSYNMPILKLDKVETYLGNNNDGGDIYAITPDNMPCLKPDKTFRFNTPIGGIIPKTSPNIEDKKH